MLLSSFCLPGRDSCKECKEHQHLTHTRDRAVVAEICVKLTSKCCSIYFPFPVTSNWDKEGFKDKQFLVYFFCAFNGQGTGLESCVTWPPSSKSLESSGEPKTRAYITVRKRKGLEHLRGFRQCAWVVERVQVRKMAFLWRRPHLSTPPLILSFII